MRTAEAVELAIRLIGRDEPETRAYAETIAPRVGRQSVLHRRAGRAGRVAGADLGAMARGPGKLDCDEMIWRRIERLPEGSRRMLEAIAVAGRPLTLRCAADAVGEADGAIRPDAALRSGHLIRGTGPRL